MLGNDLATTGTYDSDSTNRVTSPVIDVSGFEVVRLQYRRWLTVEDARWDKGTIFVNDSQVWQNVGGPDAPHHLDVEWRFHDVDITAQAATGSVQVVFELLSDTNTEYGGWNIDDVCIVGYRPGAVDAGPTDASIGPDAGGDGGGDGCGCASGGSPSGTLFLVALALLGLSRRRARPCWLSGRG